LVLAKLIEIFRPVGQAFYDLGVTLGNLFSTFSKGGESVSIFTRIVDALSVPIQITASALQMMLCSQWYNRLYKSVTIFKINLSVNK
jgi:hypothetical protein